VSWDVFIQDLPESARTIAEIPDDFEPQALGKRIDVVTTITECFDLPHSLQGEVFTVDLVRSSIEISVGEDDPCRCVALHIYGGIDAAPAVARLLNCLGRRGLDTATSEIISADNDIDASIAKWASFRDRMIAA
jgi:hypothetical protein